MCCSCQKGFAIQLFQGSYHQQATWRYMFIASCSGRQLGNSSRETSWAFLWGEVVDELGLLTALMSWSIQNSTRLLYCSLFLPVNNTVILCYFLKWFLQRSAPEAQHKLLGLTSPRGSPTGKQSRKAAVGCLSHRGAGVHLLPHTALCPARTCLDIQRGVCCVLEGGCLASGGSFSKTWCSMLNHECHAVNLVFVFHICSVLMKCWWKAHVSLRLIS